MSSSGPGFLTAAVLAAAPDAVISVDEHGLVVALNPAAEHLFGYRRSEALGRPVADLVVPEAHRAAHVAGMNRALAGAPPRILGRRVEYSARNREGNEFPVELTVTRTQMTPVRFTAWIRDLTERRAMEAKLALRQVLLERAEQVGGIGSWHWQIDSDELLWSDNLYRLYGLSPREIEPTPSYLVERAHPDDRERLERHIESSRRASEPAALEYRIIRQDGTIRHLSSTHAPVETSRGRPLRMVGCVRDVTEERRAQREIAAHFAVSEALTDWTALLPGATDLLRRLGEAMECQMGVMWIPDGPLLVSRVLWHSPSLDAAALEPIVAERRLPRGVGLPGRVWESAEPRVSKPLDDAPQAVRAAVARAGLTGSLALPALAARGVLVVLEFHCQEKVELSERLARSLTGIGYELGAFLARRHGELVPSVLTPRELEVLQLAAGGYPRREVADRLMVSPSTIKTHLEHIYAKLGVSDRAAAVAQGLRTGLIE